MLLTRISILESRACSVYTRARTAAPVPRERVQACVISYYRCCPGRAEPRLNHPHGAILAVTFRAPTPGSRQVERTLRNRRELPRVQAKLEQSPLISFQDPFSRIERDVQRVATHYYLSHRLGYADHVDFPRYRTGRELTRNNYLPDLPCVKDLSPAYLRRSQTIDRGRFRHCERLNLTCSNRLRIDIDIHRKRKGGIQKLGRQNPRTAEPFNEISRNQPRSHLHRDLPIFVGEIPSLQGKTEHHAWSESH